VAVVSGRPAAFVVDRLGLGPHDSVLVSGLYGMETAIGGRVVARPEAERWRPVIEEAAVEAERAAPSGVIVERKGLSLTVHYRTDPAEEAWVREWTGEAARRHGLVAHRARMSWELRVPLEIDKGSVVAELAASLDAACFVGDDVGDLPAFAALDALPATTLKVAVRSPELALELAAAADVVVDGPGGALAFLRRLAG
jgi:trehalose 6-phosphate phosphatase